MKRDKDSEGKPSPEGTAPKQFPKTDARYWAAKVFQRTGDEFHARLRHGGIQRRWPLKTSNRDAAAAKARDIYLSLAAIGYERTVDKFKPWEQDAVRDSTKPTTVGEFIEAVRTVAEVRATTFLHYSRKFRFLCSQIAKIKGTKKRHDYVHHGSDKWRAKVDAVPLAEITPEKVARWRVSYISAAGQDPLQQNSARQSAASIIRNAKALFSPALLKNVKLPLPSPLPLEGVELGKCGNTRYKSKVNAPLLIKLAHDELKKARPALFDIFLLGIGAGLRRNEIDKLMWKQFNWGKGVLSIETTEYGTTKTQSSEEEIDLGDDLIAHFKERFTKSKSEFVIDSAVDASQPKHWNHYRCDHHFTELIEWLREKGVDSRNPLHVLRKEFGSLVNQKFGLFAASAALRHSSITITRDHYLDRKERFALNVTELAGQAAAAPTKKEEKAA